MYYLVVSIGSDDPETEDYDPTETRRFPYAELEHAQMQRDHDAELNKNEAVKYVIVDEDENEVTE